MKRWHGFMEKDGKFIIRELAGFETIAMEAEDNPFIAFSLGEIEANTKKEAEEKFKKIFIDRIK